MSTIYLYLGIGLVALLALGGYTWKVHNVGYHSRDKEVAALIEERDAATAANETNAGTIRDLKAANAQLAADRAADKKAADDAVLAQQARANQLTEQLRASRMQREKVYEANPTARIWADDTVPVAVLASLRAAASDGADGQGGGQGAGVRQAGPAVDAAGAGAFSAARWLEEQGLRGLVGVDPFGLEGSEPPTPQDRRAAAGVISAYEPSRSFP